LATLLAWSLISHFCYPENHNRLGPSLFFNGKLSSLENLHFLFANFFILGLDWLYFIGFNSIGHFVFSKTIQGAQELIILRPAWSLSIEMLFYLLTPFLVKLKKHLLLLVLLVLLLLRFLAYQKGYNGINWMYQFFPFELALFLMGGLAYQLSKTVTNNLASYSNYFYFSLLLSFPLLAFIPFNAYTCWGYYALVCLVLVFANQAPKKFKRIDLLLGQLSFPIYLIHLIALIMVEDIFKTNNPVLFLLVLILLTIPLFFLQKKINSLRSLIQK
jgi:peptidoglycan/LPS O-acetylase OafA/YrhL